MDIDLKESLKLLEGKISDWYEGIIKLIPNIAVAFIVLIAFMILAKMAKKLVAQILPRLTKNKAVINLLTTLTSFGVMLVGLFVALEILNLDKTVTSILAGAGVIGLALGFAFQEVASNFVSGILIAFREPYQIGDIVKAKDYFGEVTKINLRTTSLMTFDGLEVYIPNKYLFTEPFINYTTTPTRRLDILVGISYGDDLDQVEKITREALEAIEQRDTDREIEIYFQEFGSSSINFQVRIWVEYPGHQSYLKARHTAIKNIKKAFDKNEITIPFPIRTIDFGIKGGKGLADALQSVDFSTQSLHQ
tara:strand:+ start:10279 stop:11196 length:918 start_codon:yes stop_codon:yes gene_type:complete